MSMTENKSSKTTLNAYIEATRELEAYRKIGTVEELKTMKENGAFSAFEMAQLIAKMNKLKEYEAIGTVEECRTAVKKHNKKIKPLKIHDRFCCPCCTTSTQEIILSEHNNYCFLCGQKLDWSKGKE